MGEAPPQEYDWVKKIFKDLTFDGFNVVILLYTSEKTNQPNQVILVAFLGYLRFSGGP